MTEASPASLKIAVGIATVGRAAVLRDTLCVLRSQTRRPDRLVISSPTEGDVEGAQDVAPEAEFKFGIRGLTAQRNLILDRCRDCDVVVFFDDDFIPDQHYLARLETIHRDHPDTAMVTGLVIADGVTLGGISLEEAELALQRREPHGPNDALGLREIYNGYGCNMSVNVKLASSPSVRFDENLPLYSWLEDVDFSRALARFGRVVEAPSLIGVHLGVKAGRQPGVRLGYSQIANPIYIHRKGNLSFRRALWQILRNVASNIVKSVRPEPYIDRKGRAMGNLLALVDLLTGRLVPGRVLTL